MVAVIIGLKKVTVALDN